MKLRTRLLVTICAALAAVVIVSNSVATQMLLREFNQLERGDFENEAMRNARALVQMQDELHAKTGDWAKWDDSYQFMVDKNPDFIRSNMVDASLSSLHADVVFFVTPQEQLHFCHVLQRQWEGRMPNAILMFQRLNKNHYLKNFVNKPDGERGLMVDTSGTYMVSMRPILPSSGVGQSRGWLIFCRLVDNQLRENLRHLTKSNVSLLKVDATSTEKRHGDILTGFSRTQAIVIENLDDATLQGFSMAREVHGKPAFLIRTLAPRNIYQQGQVSIMWLSIGIFMVGAVLAVCVLILNEKFVFSRLSRLHTQVQSISEFDPSIRVELNGSDELASLSKEINRMLDNLEEANRSRAEQDILKLQTEILEKQVADRTRQLSLKNQILENAIEGIAELNGEHRFISANYAFGATLGYQAQDLMGMHWKEVFSPDEHENLSNSLYFAASMGRAETEITGIRPDGTGLVAEVTTIYSETGSTGSPVLYVFLKDVSERKQLEKDIQYMAFHDKLTGLPNRILFTSRLEAALDRQALSKKLHAVLFVDLDNFKLLNDSLGHLAGDRLLAHISELLRQVVRPQDTVARLGGDEFTVLLTDLDSEREATDIADAILAGLQVAFSVEHGEIYASASIGIAFAHPDHDPIDADTLLGQADMAMYHAKAQSKACAVCYDPIMNRFSEERFELETALRKGIDSDEIFVQYQPLVDMQTGKLCGAEALARWQHPTRGVISPGVFIPIAEEAGLIIPIGYAVLEQACQQAEAWRPIFEAQSGTEQDFIMNVNLSGIQIQRPDMVDRVAEILERTKLPARCLKLEITESVLMNDRNDIVTKLKQLREMGVKLALDDFGTGYSSLSTLRAFPINTLKIDRAFVNELQDGGEASAVIIAIISLARAMGMTVTAEGVETTEQSARLKELGADVGQGYLYSRPQSAIDFSVLLETHKVWETGEDGGTSVLKAA